MSFFHFFLVRGNVCPGKRPNCVHKLSAALTPPPQKKDLISGRLLHDTAENDRFFYYEVVDVKGEDIYLWKTVRKVGNSYKRTRKIEAKNSVCVCTILRPKLKLRRTKTRPALHYAHPCPAF